MKILAVLCASLACAAAPALGQAARLTGDVDVELERGAIAATLCLHGAPARGDTTVFELNRGLNIKRVRGAGGKPLPFTAESRDEAVRYTVRDTTPPGAGGPAGVCVEYTGAFPVYRVAAGDFRDGDGSGVIAFDGATLRARGESRWYPVPVDPASGEEREQLGFAIHLRCPACTRLYVNGVRPVDGAEGEFASEVPRELVLFVGGYPARVVEGTRFLGEAVNADTARMFLEQIGAVRRFYEQFTGVPYGPGPDVLRITPVSRFGRYQFWGFLADPALGLAGRITIADFVEILGDPRHPGRAPLLGVLAHELAHRYFTGQLAPGGEYTQLFGEPFANYLDLQARRHFLGEDAWRAGIVAMRERALDGPDLPALDTASAAAIRQDRYRYGVAPLLLVALQNEAGEARMRGFLRALLTAPASERGRLDYGVMRTIALRSGIAASDWARWEERCVRPPLSRNECLRRLPDR